MNEQTRQEAERALLAQRVQLQFLHRALRTLEGDVAALESESARQASDLSRLDEQIAQFRAEAGRARTDARESSDTVAAPETVDDARPSARETRPPRQRPPDSLRSVTLPDVGEDWDAYVRGVDRFIADHGIELARDPLEQLVPPEFAAEVRRRFDSQFGPAPWDRWDYSVVALAVLVGALTDYLLVATPGGSFRGEPQRGSPLTAWMKEQSKKLAPMRGPDGVERTAFQQWIAELTTAAESWAKVPYDVVSPKLGLTPNVHRLASLGHDPLLGLVFGVGDIISGTCTFIDKSGAWKVIDHPHHAGTGNPLDALIKVTVHGFSDVFTAQGLPPPFLAPFQLVGARSGFTLRAGGDPVSVRDVARYMYANGYDLRHFMTTTISPAIAETILWTYHGVRACADGAKPGEAGNRGKTEASTDAGPHPRTARISQHPEDGAVRLESHGDQPRPVRGPRDADAVPDEACCREGPLGRASAHRRLGGPPRRRSLLLPASRRFTAGQDLGTARFVMAVLHRHPSRRRRVCGRGRRSAQRGAKSNADTGRSDFAGALLVADGGSRFFVRAVEAPLKPKVPCVQELGLLEPRTWLKSAVSRRPRFLSDPRDQSMRTTTHDSPAQHYPVRPSRHREDLRHVSALR